MGSFVEQRLQRELRSGVRYEFSKFGWCACHGNASRVSYRDESPFTSSLSANLLSRTKFLGVLNIFFCYPLADGAEVTHVIFET